MLSCPGRKASRLDLAPFWGDTSGSVFCHPVHGLCIGRTFCSTDERHHDLSELSELVNLCTSPAHGVFVESDEGLVFLEWAAIDLLAQTELTS